MLSSALKTSFGKVLTMMFQDDSFVISPDAQEKDKACCTHSMFQDHVRYLSISIFLSPHLCNIYSTHTHTYIQHTKTIFTQVRFFAYKDLVARFEHESVRNYEIRTCSVGIVEKEKKKPVLDLPVRYLPTLKTELSELRQHLEQIVVKVGNKIEEAIELYNVSSVETSKEIKTLKNLGESVESDADSLRASLLAISTKENSKQLDLNAARRQLWLVSRTWLHKLIKLWPLGVEEVVVSSTKESNRQSLPTEWNMENADDGESPKSETKEPQEKMLALFDAMAAKHRGEEGISSGSSSNNSNTTDSTSLKRDTMSGVLSGGVLSGFMKFFNGNEKAKSVVDEIMKISYPLCGDFSMSLPPSSENVVVRYVSVLSIVICF